ncbi:MAG: hypothetical protein AAGG57_09930 [Pseudomonadota bacterium]
MFTASSFLRTLRAPSADRVLKPLRRVLHISDKIFSIPDHLFLIHDKDQIGTAKIVGGGDYSIPNSIEFGPVFALRPENVSPASSTTTRHVIHRLEVFSPSAFFNLPFCQGRQSCRRHRPNGPSYKTFSSRLLP